MSKLIPARNTFLGASVATIMLTTANAQETPPSFSAAAAREVVAHLDKDHVGATFYNACPADVFRKEASLSGLLPPPAQANPEQCAQYPADCHRQCVEKRSAEHCFRLALAFQEHADDVPKRAVQTLFQMACALGKASGCTNRAAHLRNATDESEPLASLPQAEQEICERRSFAVACDHDDAWGCAMLGQAYRNGEGGARDPKSARRAYKKACQLDPDFAACDFAREALGNTGKRHGRR